jgi:hypothetical protein
MLQVFRQWRVLLPSSGCNIMVVFLYQDVLGNGWCGWNCGGAHVRHVRRRVVPVHRLRHWIWIGHGGEGGRHWQVRKHSNGGIIHGKRRRIGIVWCCCCIVGHSAMMIACCNDTSMRNGRYTAKGIISSMLPQQSYYWVPPQVEIVTMSH